MPRDPKEQNQSWGEEKSRDGGHTIFNFNTYYKAIVIKTLWH